MPELTTVHIALLVVATMLGLLLGWMFRGSRSHNEKSAINAGWQEQLEAQRNEHQRLFEQNKSLMEQNSQYQASTTDSRRRATELSEALKEAFERRDELQRQIKDIRGNLEAAIAARDQLQSDIASRSAEDEATSIAIRRRDEMIEKLTRELHGWQERVPPLVERFRARNEEATRLEEELVEARERIGALESMVGSDSTRVEPVDPEAMRDGLDASNEPLEGDDEMPDASEYVEQLAEDEAPELLAAEELESLIESDARDNAPITVDFGARDNRDDLKLIKGVGPAIEKTLNEMGICRFDQLAEMSEYEIDRIAQRLKGFRSRIYREDWVGQARELRDQKVSTQA